MKQETFNWGTVFSVIVLLVYAYISFLGLVYWRKGDILLPLLLAVVFIVFVLACLTGLRKSKASRYTGRKVKGQAVFGFLILISFIVAAIPFSTFTHVLERKKQINESIMSVYQAAQSLDESYVQYANTRIANYQERLEMVSNGKRSNPSAYRECMEGAYGNTDDEKIANLSKSLKMTLLPDSTTAMQEKRSNWLQSVKDMTVLNVMLPANIQKINDQVQHWTDNYKTLSSKIYQGEEAEAFTYPKFSNSLEDLTGFYTKLGTPTPLSIILAVVAWLIMLLPYFMTRTSLAGRTSNTKDYE